MTITDTPAGGPIEVEQVQNKQDPAPKIEAETTPGAGLSEAEKAKVAAEIEARLQPVLIDATITMVGNLLQQFTKMEQMNFTKAEHDALLEAWKQVLPMVSPWTNVAITTLLILGGKGLYYYANKPKPAKPEKPAGTDTAAKESQPSPAGVALKPTD